MAKAMEKLERHLRATVNRKFKENPWGARHVAEFDNWNRSVVTPTQARGLVLIIRGLAVYADAHKHIFPHPVSDDSALSPHYQQILEGVRGLLDGPTQYLDCGSVLDLLHGIADVAGFAEVER